MLLPSPTALAAMPASDHYLVEATVTDVVAEVLVAVRRDPPIGWLVSLGFGGVMTEVWSDVTHLLAPVTADDVRSALDDDCGATRCSPGSAADRLPTSTHSYHWW